MDDIHFQHIPSHQETHNYSFKNSVLIPAAKWAYLPISKIRGLTSSSIKNTPLHEEYLIEYSVFRPIKGLPELNSHKDILIHLRDTIESETNKPFEFLKHIYLKLISIIYYLKSQKSLKLIIFILKE